ncbi:MAG: phage baseplate protein, partial [Faecalibacterium sp.]
MSIITYPLNGVVYSAEDVATYLCTRTSGVYSKETNFAVSITGTRQITVAPGLAWINYDDFKGVSVCSREENVLTVPEADNTLNRVDRVVLQFDTSENITAIKLKTGTPAVAAQPPDILQNHNQYELGLCTISVPAGSTAVTVADIYDTRADETVCGVMRDGVTGIPTGTLVQQWKAVIESMRGGSFYTRAEVDALLKSLKSVDPFPVGSIYQSTARTSPAALFGGTWQEIAQNRVLMGAGSGHAAGTTVEAGLPNITGSFVADVKKG